MRIVRGERDGTQRELDTTRQQVTRLQDQLVMMQSDRDRFRGSVDQREAQIGTVQAELAGVRRELASAQGELKQLQLSGQDREQQLIVDREGYKWQLDRMQRELERAQASYRKLSEEQQQLSTTINQSTVKREEYERIQQLLTNAQEHIAKLRTEMELKDSELMQAKLQLEQQAKELVESHQALFQAQELVGGSAVPPAIDSRTLGQPVVPGAALPLPPISDARPAGAPTGLGVKIYRKNDEHGFLVLSLAQPTDAREGDTLLLYSNDQPAAELQLGQVDQDGLVVAYIKRRYQEDMPFEVGKQMVARLFIKPSDEGAAVTAQVP
jgi:hypothetical protein